MQTRVGEQDVQRTELLDGLGKQPLDLVFLGNIGTNGDCLPARRTNFFRELFSRFSLGVVIDHDRRPGICQSAGSRSAQTGTGAGDECDLLLERDMHRFSASK